MLYRVLMGAGLFLFGYYLGREVKRKVSADEKIASIKRGARKVNQASAE